MSAEHSVMNVIVSFFLLRLMILVSLNALAILVVWQEEHLANKDNLSPKCSLKFPWSWQPGLVVCVIRHMNKVILLRAQLVLGWVTIFGIYHLCM